MEHPQCSTGVTLSVTLNSGSHQEQVLKLPDHSA